MKHLYLSLSLAAMIASCIYFYRSFHKIEDMNSAIHCCLLGILSVICLLSIMLNDKASWYMRRMKICFRKSRRK